MTDADVLRLEGFAENLKSKRLYCVGSPNLLPALIRSRIEIVDGEVAHRGRKVLFVQDDLPALCIYAIRDSNAIIIM